MELQSKADWFALIGAMETGSPQPSAVTRAVALLKGGMDELNKALAAAGEAVEQWPATRESAIEVLGENLLLQEQIKGRRDRKSKQARQKLKAIKAATLVSVEKGETANYVLTESALAFLGLQGLAQEIMNQLHTETWETAAERMREYWDTVEATTKRMMRRIGA